MKKIDDKLGNGSVAEAGTSVTVHYSGWLYDDLQSDNKGNLFDSSHERGIPFSFELGSGMVIQGWEEGVAGMKIGGKRTLVIPPEMAYGEQGAGGVIPPHATLLFEVELLAVE